MCGKIVNLCTIIFCGAALRGCMGFGACWFGTNHKRELCGTSSIASKKLWEPFDTGEDQGQWDAEYWNHPHIHGLGNTGWGGSVHAWMAPMVTKMIDHIAYDGMDARAIIHRKLRSEMNWATSADLCCGTGISTPPYGIGVDTSEDMIGIASKRILCESTEKKRFRVGNAESWGTDNQFELVTCMFSFHEMPAEGRKKVIQNMMRIASKKAVIVDIDPSYVPSKEMLSGEPYVLDYLTHIIHELDDWDDMCLIENHVRLWEINL